MHRPVKIWLWCVIFFAVCLLMLNPTQRLLNTNIDFAYSINIIPPLNTADWVNAYARYIASFDDWLRDTALQLPMFKKMYILQYIQYAVYTLFFMVFFIPIIVFIIKKKIHKDFYVHIKFLTAFTFLYAIGLGLFIFSPWGVFTRESIYFTPFEIITLIIIYGSIIRLLLLSSHVKKSAQIVDPSVRKIMFATIHIMGATVFVGAFVAGLNAGFMYNDFPLMSGELIPANYFELSPFIKNFFENHATVQFNHRILGYATAITTYILYKRMKRLVSCSLTKRAIVMWCVCVKLQILLGIATLISSVHFHTALAHQFVMIVTITAGLYLMYVINSKNVKVK